MFINMDNVLAASISTSMTVPDGLITVLSCNVAQMQVH